jgi:SCL-interrupting locus protein
VISGSSSSVVNGVLRLEAIYPDFSFGLSPINTIPILATPLSILLTDSNRQDRNGTGITVAGPQMGILTMNQTRKLVLLLEHDSTVPMVPVVGCWIALPEADNIDIKVLLEHPFVWAACVRLLSSSHIRERVWIAPDTFLMVIDFLLIFHC